MKNKKYILFCLFLLYLAPAKASDITKDENKYVTISGTVKDKSDKRVLSYANVSIAGNTASTVTNTDGEFTFKVKEPIGNTTLEVSHLGYANARIRLKEGDSDLSTVWLTPSEKTHQSPILRKLIVSRISFSMKFSSHPAISLFLPIGIFFSFLLSTAVTIFVIIE